MVRPRAQRRRQPRDIVAAFTVLRDSGREILSGIFRYLRRRSGWNLRMVPSEDELTRESVAAAVADGVSGFIVTVPGRPGALEEIVRSGLPCVAVGVRSDVMEKPAGNVAFILSDNVGIGAMGAHHFLSLGRFNSFGFVMRADHFPWSGERARGFKQALGARDVRVYGAEPGEDGAYFFRETGQYAFIAYEEDSDSRAYISGSFRIADVKQPITDSFLWAPEGYSVGTVTVDGRDAGPLAMRDDRYLLMDADGLYDITFFSRSTARGIPQTYRVMLVRDTTPPVIQWEGDIQNGRFFGDVRFSVPEPDTEVSIWFNGQPAIAESHIIGAAGNYFIVASDPTGNERKYSFVLEQTMRIPREIVIGGAAVLAVIFLVMILTGKWIGRVR